MCWWGPFIAGVAIELLRSTDFLVFEETQGFSAMFAVGSAFLLGDIQVSLWIRPWRGNSE